MGAEHGKIDIGDLERLEELAAEKLARELGKDAVFGVFPEIDRGPCMRVVHRQAKLRIDATVRYDIFEEHAHAADLENRAVARCCEIGYATENSLEEFFRAPDSLMMIDLAVHVVTADQVGLDCMDRAIADDDAVAVAVEHLEDALDVEEIVLDAGHVAVAEDIVHAVRVELTGNNRMIPGMRLLRDALDDAFGHARVKVVQDMKDLAVLAHDVRTCHGLVIEAADGGYAGLEGMAERRVTDIMQERSRARDGALERIARGAGAVKDAACDMLRAQ